MILFSVTPELLWHLGGLLELTRRERVGGGGGGGWTISQYLSVRTVPVPPRGGVSDT